MTDDEILATARQWATDDVDDAMRADVLGLIERNDLRALRDPFGGALEFGTAGLRGTLGAGPNRMNRAVVRRTTAGFARYLKAHLPDAATRGVVVGRDGRMMSEEFAYDVAAVLAAEGIVAWFFPGVVPTPLAAFAVTYLKAAGAVMVTASHNPPEYNGYKVYWENGAQIIPPHDLGIAAEIAKVESAREVKLLSNAGVLNRHLDDRVERAYLAAIAMLSPTRAPRKIEIVYSAMHGVGGRLAEQAIKGAGFSFHKVAEQFEPDGRFPTVRFPNPEEPGAMDLSTALAEKVKADLVLANDPDADRLAVMSRQPETGALRLLSGNELGVVLGHFLLTQTKPTKNTLVETTIVSSAQLKSLAQDLGASYEETLTGFKWIANRALELLPSGKKFLFGYEEAIGYSVGEVVRDKDGIGTALVVSELAAWCKERGTTLLGYLEEIQRAHGLFVASQSSFTFPGQSGAALIVSLMNAFRSDAPSRVGEHEIIATNDYHLRTRSSGAQQTALTLPSSNVVAYELAGGSRITLRPSGTEPKVKFYFELKESLTAGEPMAAAKIRAEVRLQALRKQFLELAHARGLPRS